MFIKYNDLNKKLRLLNKLSINNILDSKLRSQILNAGKRKLRELSKRYKHIKEINTIDHIRNLMKTDDFKGCRHLEARENTNFDKLSVNHQFNQFKTFFDIALQTTFNNNYKTRDFQRFWNKLDRELRQSQKHYQNKSSKQSKRLALSITKFREYIYQYKYSWNKLSIKSAKIRKRFNSEMEDLDVLSELIDYKEYIDFMLKDLFPKEEIEINGKTYLMRFRKPIVKKHKGNDRIVMEKEVTGETEQYIDCQFSKFRYIESFKRNGHFYYSKKQRNKILLKPKVLKGNYESFDFQNRRPNRREYWFKSVRSKSYRLGSALLIRKNLRNSVNMKEIRQVSKSLRKTLRILRKWNISQLEEPSKSLSDSLNKWKMDLVKTDKEEMKNKAISLKQDLVRLMEMNPYEKVSKKFNVNPKTVKGKYLWNKKKMLINRFKENIKEITVGKKSVKGDNGDDKLVNVATLNNDLSLLDVQKVKNLQIVHTYKKDKRSMEKLIKETPYLTLLDKGINLFLKQRRRKYYFFVYNVNPYPIQTKGLKKTVERINKWINSEIEEKTSEYIKVRYEIPYKTVTQKKTVKISWDNEGTIDDSDIKKKVITKKKAVLKNLDDLKDYFNKMAKNHYIGKSAIFPAERVYYGNYRSKNDNSFRIQKDYYLRGKMNSNIKTILKELEELNSKKKFIDFFFNSGNRIPYQKGTGDKKRFRKYWHKQILALWTSKELRGLMENWIEERKTELKEMIQTEENTIDHLSMTIIEIDSWLASTDLHFNSKAYKLKKMRKENLLIAQTKAYMKRLALSELLTDYQKFVEGECVFDDFSAVLRDLIEEMYKYFAFKKVRIVETMQSKESLVKLALRNMDRISSYSVYFEQEDLGIFSKYNGIDKEVPTDIRISDLLRGVYSIATRMNLRLEKLEEIMLNDDRLVYLEESIALD